MDKAKVLCVNGLILGTVYLTRNAGSTFVFDKPVHSTIVLLASCAIVVLVASRFLPKEGGRTSKGQHYDAVPLSEVGQPHRSRESSPSPEDGRYPSSLRKLRICFFLLIIGICVRVALARYTIANIQCTTRSWAPLIPLVFAAYDYWTSERHQHGAEYNPNGSVHDGKLQVYFSRSPYRFLYACAMLSLGSMVGLSTASGPPSTFVCASTLSNHWLVPFVQHLSTVLDVGLLYLVKTLLDENGNGTTRGLSLRMSSVGWALLIAAANILLYGVLYTLFMTNAIQRKRILEIPPVYVWSLMKFNSIACFTLLSACIAILHVGWMTVACVTTFVSLCTLTTTHAWESKADFPPTSAGFGLIGFCLITAGFASYLYFDAASQNSSHRAKILFAGKMPASAWLALFALLALQTSLWATTSFHVNFHPIDLLIHDAQAAHNTFIDQVSASKSLVDASKTYRDRYGRHPPPGFDKWYQYATERKSLIIDNFDSIDNDLLPFWALTPQQIRERTWQMMSNPWHDASGLSIRNGKVEASPSKFMMPTHAWMLEGLVKMIGNFAEWLPDMDLAFNVNDECRVAVPFEAIKDMRRIGSESGNTETRVENTFSTDRAEGWIPLPDEPNGDRVMREMSWQKMFHEFGNAGCPSDSPGKTQRHVNVGELCTSCTAPQSLGAFLANWTLANDICHQPDMSRLHGIYVAPAAFKATHELYPVFSQSRVAGFNDILYPSAWNYIDKARYNPNDDFLDPPWAEKNSTVFWRGATSEGFSSGGGQWKGMTRQRFVHLANGVNGTSSIQHAILVPSSTAPDAKDADYTYRNLPLSALTTLLPTDIKIANSIARCGGRDCEDQVHEFAPLAEPTDFQAHWHYKYLLDLDGAGFSGRFLPFLESRSLPFKAAVFREWWDERVTAWKHFVPLDVRGQGFWATLAYFAGMDDGGGLVMPGHEREGERIAEEGREWAGKVLRKEDMEIYFFRLLLEWGRLTDDRREEIGYPG